MVAHADLDTTNHHKPGYVQSGDPGAIGAGKLWIDTSGGSGAWVTKIRNDANTGWEIVGASSGSDGGWLAAGETWTYDSADDPSYTFTISGDKTSKYSAGMRIRISQATGGTKYFIITKVAYSAPNTTVTIYGGTDYDLVNQAISSPYYSREKAPFGFPLNQEKWTEEFRDQANRLQAAPAQNTWYNPGTLLLNVPIGAWKLYYQGNPRIINSIAQTGTVKCSLSTANNSVSDDELTSIVSHGNLVQTLGTVTRSKEISVTVKTPYYLIIATSTASNVSSISFFADDGNPGPYSPSIIRAVCAYL